MHRMRVVVTLLLVLLASAADRGHAQGFNAVFSADGFDVWAVGNGGTVYRSYNSGGVWSSHPLGSANHRGVAAAGARIWIVDDAGQVWMSKDHGYTFNESVPASGTPLYDVSFIDATTGWIAGANGLLLVTTDAGQSWSPRTSGVTSDLHAVRFDGALEGWACGAGGTVIHTSNGGTTWSTVPVFAQPRDLFDVAVRGNAVYVGGSYAAFARSEDGGQTWTQVDLRIWAQSDVNAVFVQPDGTLWLGGGGGFLRRSRDGGRTFDYPLHKIMSPVTGVWFYGANRGWACAGGSKVVEASLDGGNNWAIPGGGAYTHAWTLKYSNNGTSVRGNTIRIDPVNRNKLYAVQGRTVIASWDRGDHWTPIAIIPGEGYCTNAFLVSPTDTNTWLAITQTDDRISRTTNGGVSWTVPLRVPFTEYGLPLEQDFDHPNTVYFGPEDGKVYKSTDFGASWAVLSNPGFRSPDDISVVPDTTGVIYVSDGVTGSGQAVIWKSADGGLTWSPRRTVPGSEVPMIPISRLDKWIAYATDWSAGGVQRTIDMGETWVDVRGTFSEWGADIAKDDPNVTITATYSGNTAWATIDRGVSWLVGTITGSNYGVLAYDRSTWLAHQSGGVFKATVVQADMPVSNEEMVTVLVPNGNEEWSYNELHSIRWTSQNFPQIRIELQTEPAGPWQPLVAETPAGEGTWEWTLPPLYAENARIRVGDALDGVPSDESDLPFAIVLPALSAAPEALDFVQVPIGNSGSATLHITNSGTGNLVLSSVTVEDGGPFTPNRTSFTIPAGATDTLVVHFEPIAPMTYVDTLVIATNTPESPARIPLTGKGTPPLGVDDHRRPPERFALHPAAPNPFGRAGTVISYDLPRETDVRLEVYNVLGQSVATLIRDRQPAGSYAVRFPGAARVARGAGSILPNGVYFLKLNAGGDVATRRIVLVR